jgi:hypothetical protein
MNAALNCCPGDRALIVTAPDYNPWMLGLVVTCLALEDHPQAHAAFAGRVWRVDRGLIWKPGEEFVATPHIPDAFLRPGTLEAVFPAPPRPSVLGQLPAGQVTYEERANADGTVTFITHGIPDNKGGEIAMAELLQEIEDDYFESISTSTIRSRESGAPRISRGGPGRGHTDE